MTSKIDKIAFVIVLGFFIIILGSIAIACADLAFKATTQVYSDYKANSKGINC